ncbi:MAG: zonular occludens toxin domain-containing protein [Magnetococcus sp. XQGC-1]
MRLIIAELRLSNRRIVTNVAINLERLNEYLQSQDYPAFSEHILQRITILDESALREFYRYRGSGVFLPLKPSDQSQQKDGSFRGSQTRGTAVADFSQAPAWGVLYVIDEVHIAFNARAWVTTGEGVIYYLSQHRKLGDDVILVTQSVMNVDRQMRSMAQDYTYIRNLKKERAGVFKLPGIFMRRTFLEPAGDTSRCAESGTFTLDMTGIASCYDTAKGVGIHGRAGADIGQKKKGVPWVVAPLAVVAIILALIKFTPGVVLWITKPHTVVAAASAPVKTNAVVAVVPGPAIPPGGSIVAGAARQGGQDASESPKGGSVVVSGMGELPGGRWLVFLSDGSTHRWPGGVEYVSSQYVVINGKQYPYAPSVR